MKHRIAIAALVTTTAATLSPTTTQAQVFVGEIRMFAGDFCPHGWQVANGGELPILDNVDLFAVVGTTYGGDGRSIFGLPDLRGRAPIGAGQGTGLTARAIGQQGGVEKQQITVDQMPSHAHGATSTATSRQYASDNPPLASSPSGNALGYIERPDDDIYTVPDNVVEMAPGLVHTVVSTTVEDTGNGEAFNIMQPFIAINYCIASQGQMPPRE